LKIRTNQSSFFSHIFFHAIKKKILIVNWR